MDDFGLSSIHTWLWAELDNLGIDSVIYSRHILDLFISSKYSTDFYLAKKEKSIFDLIIPSNRKRKHRYSRRSHSFSNNCTEEIAWKKQLAISCLKSAVDSSSSSNTMKSIQCLVDEIYKKLTDLRLTPDSMQKQSEMSSRSVEHKDKNRRRNNKENYDQAFPTLSPNKSPTQQTSKADKSSWPKFTKFNDKPLKSWAKSSGNQSKETLSDQTSHNKKENGKAIKKFGYGYPITSKPLKDKFRSTSNPKHTRQSPYKFNRNYRKRSGHLNQNSPEKVKGHKGNSGFRKGPRAKNNQGSRFTWKKETQSYYGNNNSAQVVSHDDSKFSAEFQCLSSGNTNSDTFDVNSTSSKWFRDPETGLLTFEPAYQLEKFKSFDEDPDHLQCVNGECRATESWMWCPSPSFWTEDNEEKVGGKPNMQSRLHSVYQHTEEQNLDKLTGKFWKEYQGIFLNLESDASHNNRTANHDSKERGVSTPLDESNELIEYDADDCVVVGFSIGLSLFNVDENPSCAIGEYEKKSKFAGFFNNSANARNSCCNKTNVQSQKRMERKNSVNIWNEANNLEDPFDLGVGEFSEKTLEILLNPGHFSAFTTDINACLFKGCFDWFNMYSDPYDCFLYDNKFDCLPMSLKDEFAIDRSRQAFIGGLKKLNDDPFLESITNNDAWKTSLRIGTVWQSISGVRPVVVIYNEKMKTLQEQGVVPSDMTHFRPIHMADIVTSSKCEYENATKSNNSNNEKASNSQYCSSKINSKTDVIAGFGNNNKIGGTLAKENGDDFLKTSFTKLGKDKCLQTSFEKDFQSRQFDESNLR